MGPCIYALLCFPMPIHGHHLQQDRPMKELLAPEANLEQAIEVIKQHYFLLHEDKRHELLNLTEEYDRLMYMMSRIRAEREEAERMAYRETGYQKFSEVPSEEPKEPPKRKPASKEAKELYRRICNLCHPDKTGKNDPQLLKLMQDAKEALLGNNLFLIRSYYDQVQFYLKNPDAYVSFQQHATNEQEVNNNPWYIVYDLHTKGDTKGAYFESMRILGELIAERRLSMQSAHMQAFSMGIDL